jgi:hypothetical protein
MDSTWIKAEQIVVNDGVNSGFRPDQIGNAQVAWGFNMAVRNGKPQTRGFAFVQRAILPKGLVQGASYFSAAEVFVVSIWGQLWRIVPTGSHVAVDSIPLASRNSAINKQAWMCETAGSLVVQDGVSAGIIYDGATARRANISNGELPVGTSMAYGNGRLAVVVNDSDVEVGDITTGIYQSELQFTETTYLSGGGAFYFPSKVSGLGFLPVNNTDTGFGSLMVFGQRFVNSLQLNITQREQWDQIPGFQQVILPKVGAASQDVIVPVNQDLYWRDGQGNIWSLRSSQWDALSPGNAPVSFEMNRITGHETEPLLQYSSGVFFDNRLLYIANPIYNQFGSASFTKIISLDALALATMRGKAPPAYDGEATGLNFTSIFAGKIQNVDRAFCISTDDDGENRLWELIPKGTIDSSFITASNGSSVASIGSPITTYFESKRFDFGQPGVKKQVKRLDMWPTAIQGPVTITAYWRADNRQQWNYWDSVTMNAQMTNNNNQWQTMATQERGRVKSFTAPTGVDVIDNQASDVGYGFQIRLSWTGYLEMDRMQVWAEPKPETAYSEQEDMVSSAIQNVVTNNQISYSIPVGGLGSAYNDQAGNVYVDQFDIPYTQQPP